MCIAIANLKDKPLTGEQIDNCWANNGDGAGILYKEDGILKIYKQLKDVEAFKTKYFEVIKNSNCLLHFRIQTSGGVNYKNCHPFMVNKNLGFIHNGTIYGFDKKLDGKSDTSAYNHLVLKKMPRNFLDSPELVEIIEDHIGGSKFVFMDVNENITIMDGKNYGHYNTDGNWFSNDSYKKVNSWVYAGNKKVAKKGCNLPAPKQPIKYLSKWSQAEADGLIIVEEYAKDMAIVVDTGQILARHLTSRPEPTWFYNAEFGGYIEPIADTKLRQSKETEILPADEQWWNEQVNGPSYEEVVCDLFDQVPLERINKLLEHIASDEATKKSAWDRVNSLQNELVKYPDYDGGVKVEMLLGAAVSLVRNQFGKTDKTFVHVLGDYVDAGVE